MRALVICSLLFVGLSALAKGKKSAEPVPREVTKLWCGSLKPQPSIDQTPTEACFARVEGFESNLLILRAASDSKAYELDDADIRASTVNSVSMPGKVVGHVPGSPAKPEVRGKFLPLSKKSESEKAAVTFIYAENVIQIDGVIVTAGGQTYEYEKFSAPR